jgi:hypothetical protein
MPCRTHARATRNTQHRRCRTCVLEWVSNIHELTNDKGLAGVSRPDERDCEAVLERALLKGRLERGRVRRGPEHAIARERYDLVL